VKKGMISIIIDQTKILYANVEETINSIEEAKLYDANICDWPLGEQLYHMLHSMDQWFINPNHYEESKIALLKKDTDKRLSKSELIEYYNSIKAKVSKYLKELSIESLGEQPPDCQFTKLALILGQYRHLMYHIGLIHGCLRVYTRGKSPAYIGLGPPIKAVTKSS